MHITIYWQWYDVHHQQVSGGWERKTMWRLPSLTTMIKPFLNGRSSTIILLALDHVGHIVDPTPSFLLALSFYPGAFSIYIITHIYNLMSSYMYQQMIPSEIHVPILTIWLSMS